MSYNIWVLSTKGSSSINQNYLQSSASHQKAVYNLLVKVSAIYHCTKKLFLIIGQGNHFLDSIILLYQYFSNTLNKSKLIMILICCAMVVTTAV